LGLKQKSLILLLLLSLFVLNPKEVFRVDRNYLDLLRPDLTVSQQVLETVVGRDFLTVVRQGDGAVLMRQKSLLQFGIFFFQQFVFLENKT
jgi:hypothetical protein